MRKCFNKKIFDFLWAFIIIDCIQLTFSILDYLSKPELLMTPLVKLSGFVPLIMKISFFNLKNLTVFNIATGISFVFLFFKILLAIFVFLKKKQKFLGVIVLFAYILDLISLILFYSTIQFISEIYVISILLLIASVLYDLFFVFLSIGYIKRQSD